MSFSSSSGGEEGRCMYRTVSSAPPKKRSGRTKFRETRHPVYKGVRRRGTGRGRWVCEVRDPGGNKKSRIWVGTFPTAEMAARAHDVAAMALRGSSACLNFADSAWLLPVPSPSAGPRAIQRAAAEAARAFPVQSERNNSTCSTEEEEEEEEESSASSSSASITEPTKTVQPVIRGEEQRTAEMGDAHPFHDTMIGLDMDLVMTEYYCYHAIFAEGLLLVDPSAAGDDDDDSDGGDMDLSLWSFPA